MGRLNENAKANVLAATPKSSAGLNLKFFIFRFSFPRSS